MIYGVQDALYTTLASSLLSSTSGAMRSCNEKCWCSYWLHSDVRLYVFIRLIIFVEANHLALD